MTVSVPEKSPATGRFFNFLAVLGVLLGVWLAAWRLSAFTFFVYDDTYIGLRYVANFLHTGHFEWNVGEAVEGYTDPLRLWLTIIPGALGMDLLDAARLINGLAYLGFVALIYMALRHRLGKTTALLPAALAAAYPPLGAWVWGGLDPPLTVLLLALAHITMFLVFTDESKRTPRMAVLSAVFFALAFLTRMDNALYAVPAAAAWLALGGKNKKPFLIFCGVIAAVVLAQMLVRLAVYHDVLPNTFYNKVMGTPAVTFATGVKYVVEGLTVMPPYYLAGFVSLLALLLLRPAYRGFVMYGLAGILLSAVYVASVGGDFMPGHRFLMPWLPLCLLGMGLLLEKPVAAFKSAIPIRYAGLVISFFMLKSCFALSDDLRWIDGTTLGGEQVGKYIIQHWPKNVLVGINSAGIIPYLNLDKTFVDMLGLNDRVIAKRAMPNYGLDWQKKPGHGKGDGAYVLKRAPDYIILGSVAGDAPDRPVFAGDYEMKKIPYFSRCYRRESVELPFHPIMLQQHLTNATTFPFNFYKRVCAKEDIYKE